MSDDSERVWDLMERFPLCTLVTWDNDRLRSRPMTAFVRRRNEAIYFLADVRFFEEGAIRAHPDISLTFADSANGQIACLSGKAQVSSDRVAIRELWATSARDFWESPDDPNIRMLRIAPQQAQFRDGNLQKVVQMCVPSVAPVRKSGDRAAI